MCCTTSLRGGGGGGRGGNGSSLILRQCFVACQIGRAIVDVDSLSDGAAGVLRGVLPKLWSFLSLGDLEEGVVHT